MVDRIHRPFSLLLAGVIATSAGVIAQEVRLTDGSSLVGKTTNLGDQLRVETPDGPRTVAAADVVRIRTREQLSAELRELAKRHGDAPFAQLELAKVARSYGLHGAMWRHLDACWAEWDSEATGRRLATLLSDLETELLPRSSRELSKEKKVRALLKRAQGKRKARVVAIEHVLAALDGSGPALRKEARRAGSPLQRLTALRALGLQSGEGDGRFVLRSAILDSSETVRAEAMQIPIPEADRSTAVSYLSPGLMSQDAKVRTRTAEAYANLGDPAAIPFLVQAGPIAAAAPVAGGGVGPTRGYVAVIEQRSYIRDFDVEVAQAAFIADPKVDVVQSGTVFDVGVHAVTTVRTRIVGSYRRALRRLAGSDPGRDTSAWGAWYAALRQSQANATENQ